MTERSPQRVLRHAARPVLPLLLQVWLDASRLLSGDQAKAQLKLFARKLLAVPEVAVVVGEMRVKAR